MDFRQCFPAPQSPDGFSNGFPMVSARETPRAREIVYAFHAMDAALRLGILRLLVSRWRRQRRRRCWGHFPFLSLDGLHSTIVEMMAFAWSQYFFENLPFSAKATAVKNSLFNRRWWRRTFNGQPRCFFALLGFAFLLYLLGFLFLLFSSLKNTQNRDFCKVNSRMAQRFAAPHLMIRWTMSHWKSQNLLEAFNVGPEACFGGELCVSPTQIKAMLLFQKGSSSWLTGQTDRRQMTSETSWNQNSW